MKIYISGPMTGYDEWNYPAFHEAAKQLREAGHYVFNPAEAFGGATHLSYADYMRNDIHAILQVDAIAVLPGWENSKGAKLETAIAEVLGLPILPYQEMAVAK